MKKIFLILNFSFLIFNFLAAQPAIQWQKCLGGTSSDEAHSIWQTTDGGFIVACYSHSNDGDVTGNHGNGDYWIVKLDDLGAIQWQKCLGGTGGEDPWSIQQTTDGGFIVGGFAGSNDGDVTGYHDSLDYWVVKLDSSGNLQWQKCLGGTNTDAAYSVQQTADGGYVVAGLTYSINGDVNGNHGMQDYWVVKLDGSGNLQWQKCLGGSNPDYAYSIRQASDGGYIVAGYTSSNNGDVTGFHGGFDYWVVKLNGSGNLQWQKCLGGTGGEIGTSVRQTIDGGFIVTGYTASTDGDVTGNHGDYDYWVVKLDGAGNLQWQKCLGGTSTDFPNSIYQTTDGGFIVGGYTSSMNGDVTGYHGSEDFWLVKLDSSGNLQWQKCLGGTNQEKAFACQQTTDGGYIVAGYTYSNNGDVTGNHGQTDCWIVKLAPYVGIEEEMSHSFLNISPNPFTTEATITFSKEIHNATFCLYNLLAEKVAETSGINGKSFTFNRGNLQSGVYIFEVTEKEKNIARGKAAIY